MKRKTEGEIITKTIRIKEAQIKKIGNSYHILIPMELFTSGKLSPKKRYDFLITRVEKDAHTTNN